MTNDEPLYTFDDIELYMPVIYRGVPGYVVDKGDVLSGVNKRMLRLSLNKRPPGGEGTDYILAEQTVNEHLRRKKTLWADFGWAVTGE